MSEKNITQLWFEYTMNYIMLKEDYTYFNLQLEILATDG